jgi:hypothetical protein
MHASRHHVMRIDDTKYKLAQLLSKPGDRATYTYDLGDKWVTSNTLCACIGVGLSHSTLGTCYNTYVTCSSGNVRAARSEFGRDRHFKCRASMCRGVC